MMFKQSIRNYQITVFSVLAIFTAATVLPFLWVIASAFKSDAEIFGSASLIPKSWNWVNFYTAWTDGKFGVYFWNSLLIAVSVTVILAAIACPAGYAFAKMKLRKHPFVFYIILFGMTMPAQSVIIPLFYQLKSYGLIDHKLGLIIAEVGLEVPFAIYLMRNFFRDLPDELIEAAVIDGAGTWGAFRRVMLPLSKPGVLALSVFSFLGSWNEFLLSLLVLVSNDSRTIPLGLVRFSSLHTSDYGVVFAGVVFAFIPSMLIYILLQKSFVRGISSGSLK
ncbi:carbohydrate ABC transporter permease [Paenibacillus thalictri]|uniref:Carbohydrate ABC transporter permease n=1 Tax=Paenibacillus thalictri TaxID=2527873 RepID=A0A4Q9DZH6_9BACL|nr:carbohydrate ABC transporter permease [Paenibacillus thalictri]TBL81253.1 carbohydrate ABC transporter permease [Paenibacillus thalictri]